LNPPGFSTVLLGLSLVLTFNSLQFSLNKTTLVFSLPQTAHSKTLGVRKVF